MVGKRSVSSRIFDAFNGLFMVLMVVLTLYPMLYVLFASVSRPSLFMAYDGILVRPLGFTLGAYQMVFRNAMVGIGYRNTLLYLTLGTAVSMTLTILGAYVLSRTGYLLKKVFLWIALFTMYFSGGLVPFFLLVKDLGMLDKVAAMVLPSALSTYNMIVMRTAFAAVPPAMEESAKLDGANDLLILIRIFLPLVVPTLAVITLFYAVGQWNAWFNAMIFLRTREKFPLQLVLREILIMNDTNNMTQAVGDSGAEAIQQIVKYATIIVATVPILLLYPFLQRYFVKGVMIGAVKG